MRFIIADEFHEQMHQMEGHTPDCYVRPGEYLHHMYIDGVKYTVAPAIFECLAEAERRGDREALRHLMLAQAPLRRDARRRPEARRPRGRHPPRRYPARRRRGRAADQQPLRAPPAVPHRRPGPAHPLPLRVRPARHLHPRATDGRRPGHRTLHPPLRPLRRAGGDAQADSARHRRPEGQQRGRLLPSTRSSRARGAPPWRTPSPRPPTSAPSPSRSRTTSNRSSRRASRSSSSRGAASSGPSRTSSSPMRSSTRSAPPSTRPRRSFFFGFPRQRKDQRGRAHHAPYGGHHLHPPRGGGERADHQAARPHPAPADQAGRRQRRGYGAAEERLRQPVRAHQAPHHRRRRRTGDGDARPPVQPGRQVLRGAAADEGERRHLHDRRLRPPAAPADGPAEPLDRPPGKALRLPDDGERQQDRSAVRRVADLLDQPRSDPVGRRGVPAPHQVQDRNPRPRTSCSSAPSGTWSAREGGSNTTRRGSTT